MPKYRFSMILEIDSLKVLPEIKMRGGLEELFKAVEFLPDARHQEKDVTGEIILKEIHAETIDPY